MQQQTVKIIAKHSYGRELYYPDNEVAKGLLEIGESKTFTERQLKAIEKLGYALDIRGEVKRS